MSTPNGLHHLSIRLSSAFILAMALFMPFPGAKSQDAGLKPVAASQAGAGIGSTANAGSGANGTQQSDITLSSGAPQTGTIPGSTTPGQCGIVLSTQYIISTPSTATQLQVTLSGNADIDLYMRRNNRVELSGSRPVADHISESLSSFESITVTPSSFPPLQSGQYYIAISNCSSNNVNFTLTATVTIGCPSVSAITPVSGPPGSTVVITGNNFTGVNAVKFSDKVNAQFTVNSNTQITATTPAGAITGPISIFKPTCPDAKTAAFTVTPAGCNYSISPSSQSFTAAGGTGVVNVTATPNNCAWTAAPDAPWINVVSGGGTGSGAVNFTVAANPSTPRAGSINIAGQIFTITQAGALSPAGGLDEGFGQGGKVTTDFSADASARAMAIQSDGKIVLGGFARFGIETKGSLARYNSDGSLDASFANAGKFIANSSLDISGVNAVVIQPDGKIIAAGNNCCSGVDFVLMRFNSNGALDTAFGANGRVATNFANGFDSISALALQTDGKIIAVGRADLNSSSVNFGMARYTASGALDTAFGSGGKVSTVITGRDVGGAVAVQTDGKIVVAVVANSKIALLRYNSNGSADSTFASAGRITTNLTGAPGLGVQSDGKIVISGDLFSSATLTDFALMRFNANGAPDSSFGSAGVAMADFSNGTDSTSDLVIQTDGKIVAAGYANPSGQFNPDFALARFNSNGGLDNSFGSGGKVTTDFAGNSDTVYAVGLQSDGKIIAAGESQPAFSVDRVFALARYYGTPHCQSVTITPSALPAAIQGATYNQTLTASGGASPYAFSVSAGTLPAGLTFSSAGVLSGTATQTGSFPITIKATDANGCAGTRDYTLVINDSAPVITSISPNAGLAGSDFFTLTVTGSNFVSNSVVRWNGANRSTKFSSSSQLKASINSADLSNAGVASVTVFNPAPDGRTSNAMQFTINPFCLTTIAPIREVFNFSGGVGAVTVTADGNCAWNAVSNDDWITITSGGGSGNGTVSYTVSAHTGISRRTGFMTIAGRLFTVTQLGTDPAPFIANLSPHTVSTDGGAFTLTVSGLNFNSESKVLWNDSPRPTTFINGGQLTASISAADIAESGAAKILVVNPTTGQGTSENASLLINDLNLLAVDKGSLSYSIRDFITGGVNRLTPTFYPATLSEALIYFTNTSGQGEGVTILIGTDPTGKEDISKINFQSIQASVKSRNGFNTYPVPNITINSGDFLIGYRSRAFSFDTDAPSRGRSYDSFGNGPFLPTSSNLMVRARLTQPCVTIANLNPTSASPGASVTLTGSNFTGVAAVKFAGDKTAQFTINSDTQITAIVPDGAANGPITISKQGCADARTNNFTVIPLNPAPSLMAINPNSATMGDAGFTLTVTGSNFINGSIVRWNNADRPTTFVSATQLTAQIPASDIAGAGAASVTVFNPAPGGGLSNAANFNITAPVISRNLRVVAASGPAGGGVTTPIELVSQGDENALGFSLTFDPAALANPQAVLGPDAAGASLNANASQAAQGRLGLTLALPGNQTFSAGARKIINVTFTIAANASATSSNIGFGDQPVTREISDANAIPLPSLYTPAAITIVQGVEADVSPRPAGNGAATIADWTQIGRFASGMDAVEVGGEFQRADCAPRLAMDGVTPALGDGRVTVTDWVQAGRYAAGIDPPAPAGGPTAPSNSLATAARAIANARPAVDPNQLHRVNVFELDSIDGPRQTRRIAISLDARGDENALGFSLLFNPSQWRFVSAVAGRDASGATLMVNAKEALRGRIGLAMALPAGQRFDSGAREIAILQFASQLAEASEAPLAIGFGDQPVAREIVTDEAHAMLNDFTFTAKAGRSIAVASAASLAGDELAPGQIATIFGERLAASVEMAPALPLPIELGGARVIVTDSAGVARQAPLFFVSPRQINFLIPAETALGPATIAVASDDGDISTGVAQIAPVEPGLFAANANGQGVAAAVALRVKGDGTQSFEPIAQFDAATGRFTPTPIDLGPTTDQVFLVLYGTGFRNRSAPSAVIYKMGGTDAEVLGVAAVAGFAGLDQCNARIPRSLIGRGEVDVVLTVDGKAANTVRVAIK